MSVSAWNWVLVGCLIGLLAVAIWQLTDWYLSNDDDES